MEAKQEKRRAYLKKQIYLTDIEKSELSNLDELKAEYIREVNERFTNQPPAEVKKAPELTVEFVGYWFRKFWEFQNKKELIINDNNRDVINMLCLYFARDKRFETEFESKTGLDFSLNKGIFLTGFVGTGKSSMFEAFRLLGENYSKEFQNLSLFFWKHNCKQIVSEYMEKGNDEGKNIKKYFKGSVPIYFDDLGTEQNAWDVNIMQNIIEARYDSNARTFITSNLGLKTIEEKYGKRVSDRFNEMFNIISINGESFRK